MPLKLFKKNSVIGIDLGHHTINVAKMERVSGVWKVVNLVSTRTPEDAIKEGIVVDYDAVTLALKQLLKQSGISAGSACIAVAGGSVVVRTVRIPKMPEATLRKSIKFEAGRYVPNSVDDSYIEFEIMGDAGDGQMDVLIVAAPKEIVESRIRVCEDAGLEVEAVDVEAFAVFRAIVEADELGTWMESNIAIVDIGAASTNVSVVSKGIFSMTRTIPQGGQTLTEALKQYFNLSSDDAEEGKAALDFSALIDDKPAENPPLRVLQPHVDDLIREIRRSLNYYQSQHADAGASQVTQLLVLGGAAKMKGIAEYIAHKLGVEVFSIGIFDNPRITYAGMEDIGNGLELAVAGGLAMRAYAKAA